MAFALAQKALELGEGEFLPVGVNNMSKAVIETKDLTVVYGKHRGIKDVNLQVNEGEVFGFLGPNGAGKTTTLRVLLDVIRPNRGTASIFGHDCQKDGVAARRNVGYIPGELSLPPNMRGRNYLNMMDGIRRKKADADYRRELTARFDLDLSRRIREYSRGNKQKLALIAAFMHRPPLLMLDEPTGGLDPLIQQAVLDTVREAKNEGRTIFFSSHILPEVQAVCDRIGIIRHGELIAIESVSDLLAQRFRRIEIETRHLVAQDLLLIEGVRVVSRENNRLGFEVMQNLDLLMQTLAPYGIIDVHTQDVSLEEVFLAFYDKR